MAIELTRSTRYADEVQSDYPGQGEEVYALIGDRSPQKQQLALTPVVHNFLHDIESIWWVYLWTILALVNHSPSNSFAAIVFEDTFNPSLVRGEMLTTSISNRLQQHLHPMLQQLVQPVDAVRSQLFQTYRKFKDPSELSVYSPFYGLLLGLVDRTPTWVPNLDGVPFRGVNAPLTPAGVATGLKRSSSKIEGVITQPKKKRYHKQSVD